MAKKTTTRSGMQWKVYKDISVSDLQHTLDEIGASKWNVFTILGPLSGGLVIVCNRLLVL